MTRADELFLPAGYRENAPEAIDTEAAPGYWTDPNYTRARIARRYQDAVYRFAARLAEREPGPVLDVGCGTGQKLVRHLDGRATRVIGVDQPSAISWAKDEFPGHEWIAGDLRSEELWHELWDLRPSISICADVIEHVDDPIGLLTNLRGLVGPEQRLVLSTPDRDRMAGGSHLGPPKNRHHVREWAFGEMARLLESVGFTIRSSRHVLPRAFTFTVLDAKIVAWRALHLQAVPDRRSCMVFELSAA